MVRSLAFVVSMMAPAWAYGQYVFGGIAGTNSWEWGGGGMSPLRSAIADPARFGPGGTVPASATTTTLASISAAALAGIDCFVSPAIPDAAFSSTSGDAIRDWFLAGGDLLLMNDRNDFDFIGQLLSLPTQNGPGSGPGFHTAAGAGAPLMSGPFGSVTSIEQRFLVGHLDASTVASLGGTVAATNASGVAVAYWDRGAFAPGAGKLVIVTDVDTMAGTGAGYDGAANYSTMNDNAKFALNTINFFVVPAPSGLAVLALAPIAWLRRRR